MTVYVGNSPPRYDPWPEWKQEPGTEPPAMPFSTRLVLGKELNKAWAEFVEEMHDGDLTGPEVADKFWKYLTR